MTRSSSAVSPGKEFLSTMMLVGVSPGEEVLLVGGHTAYDCDSHAPCEITWQHFDDGTFSVLDNVVMRLGCAAPSTGHYRQRHTRKHQRDSLLVSSCYTVERARYVSDIVFICYRCGWWYTSLTSRYVVPASTANVGSNDTIIVVSSYKNLRQNATTTLLQKVLCSPSGKSNNPFQTRVLH